jgi:poly(3-hydroxybutyrate) depolymerase
MTKLKLVLGAVAVFGVLTAPETSASVVERSMHVAFAEVRYKVVLPDGYDAAKEYPGIIVLGGGPQTMDTVERTIERNFRAEAERRGYIVIAPAAPGGDLFFEGGERIFPQFLKTALTYYKIAGGKFHIAGPSNGGIAAMHIAAENPDYFLSVTAFPGYMWEPSTKKLLAISKMCVYLYVGENDEYRWHDEMKSEVEFLQARGTVAKYSVEKGQPHRLDTLAGASASRLFDGFEAVHNGCSR